MPENMRERTRRPVRNKRYNRLEKTCAKNILTCFEITTNMQAINKECPLRIYSVCVMQTEQLSYCFSEFEI